MFDMKQNNQSSWAARLRKISALCLALVATSSAMAQDKVTAFIKPGETKVLSVALKNDASYTAFQMQIKLPEGLSFTEDAVTLTRKADSHKVEANKVDNQTMRLVAYSYDGTTGNENLTGNYGDLLLVNVTASENFVAKDIELSDVVFVDSDLAGQTIETKVVGLLGDVDGNNKINTSDASAILMILADKVPSSYDEDAADMDQSGKVNTSDASAILKELSR